MSSKPTRSQSPFVTALSARDSRAERLIQLGRKVPLLGGLNGHWWAIRAVSASLYWLECVTTRESGDQFQYLPATARTAARRKVLRPEQSLARASSSPSWSHQPFACQSAIWLSRKRANTIDDSPKRALLPAAICRPLSTLSLVCCTSHVNDCFASIIKTLWQVTFTGPCWYPGKVSQCNSLST